MGRPVAGTRVAKMPLAVCFWVLCAGWGAAAAPEEMDVYPELMQRIQRAMIEMERQQLRLVQMSDDGPPLPRMPQFTYSFPETPRSFQSDLFAVPPSDPRYYLPETGYAEREGKRGEDEELGKGYKNDEAEANVNEFEDRGAGRPEPQRTETVDKDKADLTTTTEPNATTEENKDDVAYVLKTLLPKNEEDIVLVAIIAACGAAAAAALVALTFGWYRLHSSSKAAADIEYPAYGVTGPNKEISPTTGDRRLAQSAQMYHYQHQKQQIIAMESNRVNNERRGSVSEGDSDEENEEGDYTVYECPGLAAKEVGELEVKNPMFVDDPTPAANGINGHLPAEESKTADNK